jgi:uncharacterized protein YndB with AHSA1/START domain
MSAVDITERSQTKAIAFEFDLPHAPDKVWRALTVPELLSEWLLPVVGFELGPGKAFTLRAPEKPGWDGTVHCQLLEIEPLRKLTYTWVVGDFIDTVVTFTLTPTAEGTHMLLVQSGFRPDQKQNFGGARYGWRLMAGKLVDLLGRIT